MWKYSELSKTQKEIVNLMRNGWELGGSMSGSGGDWIQKGGLGKGGDSKNVNANTTFALYKKGVICRGLRKFPTEHYLLKVEDEIK